MSKSKILVTGGCGYIGGQTIIEILRDELFEVVSIDNFANSSKEAISRIEKITNKKVQNYNIDLCNKELLQNVFKENKDISSIIHFAALKSVPDSVLDPLRYYGNNVLGLINLLECCDKYGVKNFIFSSSCSVYGNVEKLPVTEETPYGRPESPYAHTKQIGEGIIESFVKNVEMKAISLRYFNPVGADLSGYYGEAPTGKVNNLVPVITKTAAGILPQLKVFGNDYDTRDGSCIRDYVHVIDIALAHILALKHLHKNASDIKYDVFNLGTGNGVTVFEAINAFEKVSKLKLNYKIESRRDGDIAAIFSNSRKAKEILGWQTKYSIEEMMASAWKWQQQAM